jgi:hypothetical protein
MSVNIVNSSSGSSFIYMTLSPFLWVDTQDTQHSAIRTTSKKYNRQNFLFQSGSSRCFGNLLCPPEISSDSQVSSDVYSVADEISGLCRFKIKSVRNQEINVGIYKMIAKTAQPHKCAYTASKMLVALSEIRYSAHPPPAKIPIATPRHIENMFLVHIRHNAPKQKNIRAPRIIAPRKPPTIGRNGVVKKKKYNTEQIAAVRSVLPTTLKRCCVSILDMTEILSTLLIKDGRIIS